jgi:hypothetical protein
MRFWVVVCVGGGDVRLGVAGCAHGMGPFFGSNFSFEKWFFQFPILEIGKRKREV